MIHALLNRVEMSKATNGNETETTNKCKKLNSRVTPARLIVI